METTSNGNKKTLGGGLEEIQSIGDVLTQRQRKRFKTGDRLLGRYRIVGELGQGGMGLVFRCLDEIGGIEVAVKMLPPEVSHDSGEMEEVRENFALVAGLAHPNIAMVRTLEKDPDTGEYFLVMELAQGVNLRQWRKSEARGPRGEGGGKSQYPISNNHSPISNGIPLAQILPIVRQVAAALDHAHENKVIHRDIKPSNVMVDAAGHVKVLDFGLAAQIHTSFSRVSQVRYGTSGTGPYMAPEQWRGQYQDGATDQYALAILAYELIAGHCPFESHETSVLRESVLKEEPARPKGLPEPAWQALKLGLAKEREGRFASCGEFARALGGEKISPQRAQRAGGGWKWGLGVLLLAGLVAGGYRGYLSWQNREKAKAEQAQRAVAAAQMDAERRAQAEALRGEVEAALARGDLKAAGEKLADLQGIAGAQGLADGLRKQYESAAGAQDVRQRHAKAQTAYEDAQNIPDGPGFEARKRLLKEQWMAADLAEKAQAWGEALSAFDAVLAACRDLETADRQRREAETAQETAEDAKQEAAGDGAATDAEKAWGAALAAEKAASDLFEKADFTGTLAGWQKAAGLFETARQRAKAVQAYGQAENDYGQALSPADQALLNQYGGAAWKTARQKAVEGAASADQPETGRQAYVDALAALNAALAEVEKKATPSLVIAVTADGKDVAATVTDGGRGRWTTPTTAIKLEKGKRYTFTATYDDPSGKRWSPAELKLTADWAGPQTQTVSLEEAKGPVAGSDWTSPATGMEFVWIDALGIWVGKYEVANEEFRKFRPGHDSGESQGHSLAGPRQPVVNANFPDDALPFVDWLNRQDAAVLDGAEYRLPTESEWQTFAQCGDGRTYPWGDDMPPDYGNYADDAVKRAFSGWQTIDRYNDGFAATCSVEESGKNDWNLYGVGGNAWEMATKNGNPASFGAWRGASWVGYSPVYLRCDCRSGRDGSLRNGGSGFRLVLSR